MNDCSSSLTSSGMVVVVLVVTYSVVIFVTTMEMIRQCWVDLPTRLDQYSSDDGRHHDQWTKRGMMMRTTTIRIVGWRDGTTTIASVVRFRNPCTLWYVLHALWYMALQFFEFQSTVDTTITKVSEVTTERWSRHNSWSILRISFRSYFIPIPKAVQ